MSSCLLDMSMSNPLKLPGVFFFFSKVRMSLYDVHEVFTADSKLPVEPAAETVVLKKSPSALFPPLEIVMLSSW